MESEIFVEISAAPFPIIATFRGSDSWWVGDDPDQRVSCMLSQRGLSPLLTGVRREWTEVQTDMDPWRG